jgi:hypothetical protein
VTYRRSINLTLAAPRAAAASARFCWIRDAVQGMETSQAIQPLRPTIVPKKREQSQTALRQSIGGRLNSGLSRFLPSRKPQGFAAVSTLWLPRKRRYISIVRPMD